MGRWASSSGMATASRLERQARSFAWSARKGKPTSKFFAISSSGANVEPMKLPGVCAQLTSLFLAMASPAAPETLQANPHPAADLVILHGHIWTVDASHPHAEALAIVGDRIAAVSTTAEIRGWIGPGTQVIDAGGKTVLPGFIDAHVHFSSGGAEISGVQLRDAATPEEFSRRIGAHARKLREGEWITGGTWDHELGGGTLPTREWIDRLTPANPVLVSRYDGHMALANSLALRLAHVTRSTPTPPGGTIVKDTQGQPTGLLKDAAMTLIERVIPRPTEAQRLN